MLCKLENLVIISKSDEKKSKSKTDKYLVGLAAWDNRDKNTSLIWDVIVLDGEPWPPILVGMAYEMMSK